MLRRFGILLLAFVFVVGSTMQIVPRAWAMDGCAMAGASMDAPSADGQSGAPCKGLTPACVDAMGCVATVALPAPPLSTSTGLASVATTYSFFGISLSGLSVEPELSPPILLA
jgi:hypothetical protein